MSKLILVLAVACLLTFAASRVSKHETQRHLKVESASHHKHTNKFEGALKMRTSRSAQFTDYAPKLYKKLKHMKAIPSHFVEDKNLSAHNTMSKNEQYANRLYSLLATEQVQGVFNVRMAKDIQVCPTGYTYMPMEYVAINTQNICNKLPPWDIDRLQGGGSIDGPAYGCRLKISDPKNLGGGVCGRYAVQGIQKQSAATCQNGYATITVADALTNQKSICNLLGTWDVARIGTAGTFTGPGYGCEIKGVDPKKVDTSVCTQVAFQDFQVLQKGNEDNCGDSKAPVTIQEVLKNVQGYCNVMGTWDISRLAGGASLDGPGYGCNLRYKDTRSLGNVLCADVKRTIS